MIPELAPAQITTDGTPEMAALQLSVNGLLTIVGVAVGYHALRGYNRNGDRSVLVFGAGIFVLTTVRASLFVAAITAETLFELLSLFLGGIGLTLPLELVFVALTQTIDVIGLLAVFYALVE